MILIISGFLVLIVAAVVTIAFWARQEAEIQRLEAEMREYFEAEDDTEADYT